MATTLKLVWKYIDSTDIDTLDLLNNTDGFNLNRHGWSPQSGDDESNIIDVFNVRASGSSNNALAAVIQDLDQYKKRVKWASEPQETRGVYLRTQLPNESNYYESFVTALDYKIDSSIYDIYPTRASTFDNITLSVERRPFWESGSVTTSASTLTITGNIGGSVLWGDTVTGDVPARLSEFVFTHDTYSGATKSWFGFKTSRYNTVASRFVPYWPAASGLASYYSSDTTGSNDGNGRSTITCTFNTAACLVRRLVLRPNEFISSASDQRGSYLVLMAAYIDAGTWARARIGYGDSNYTAINSPVLRSRVLIDGLVWTTYEMGNITIPANYMRTADDLSGFSLRLDVERIVGTGNFYCYGFFLIPLEGMISVRSSNTPYLNTIFTKPDGHILSHTYNGTLPTADYVPLDVDWSVPANDERPYLIGAVDMGYGGAANSTIAVTYKFVKRWRTLRGSE